MRTQATIALLALGFVCSLAQTVPPSKPSPPAKKLAESDPEEHKKLLTLWHDRAMSFTGAATDDGWRIPRLRSVLNARLADASGNKDVPYATSMLTGARASLEKHAVQNPIVYIELLSLYTRLLPDDAPQALSFAIAGFNQISYPDFEKERAKNKKKLLFRWGKSGERLEPIRIDGAMVDKDEPYVTAALKTVEDPETRIAFRLTFLHYSLKQYEKELNKKPRVSSVKSASAQTVTPK